MGIIRFLLTALVAAIAAVVAVVAAAAMLARFFRRRRQVRPAPTAAPARVERPMKTVTGTDVTVRTPAGSVSERD